MPLYAFNCSVCNKEYEIRRPMHEGAAPSICPYCQSNEVQRIYSPPMLSLSNNRERRSQLMPDPDDDRNRVYISNAMIENNLGPGILAEDCDVYLENSALRNNGPPNVQGTGSRLFDRGSIIE